MKMIHVATIEHRYGTNLYARTTERKLYRLLAEDYVRQWWESEIPDEPMPKALEDQKATFKDLKQSVHDYFEMCGHESLTVNTTDLE